MTVTCKVCGAPMKAEHGIINTSEEKGMTWWQCVCGRRVREEYRVENDKIVTVEAIEL
jgi:hypothetical protein